MLRCQRKQAPRVKTLKIPLVALWFGLQGEMGDCAAEGRDIRGDEIFYCQELTNNILFLLFPFQAKRELTACLYVVNKIT